MTKNKSSYLYVSLAILLWSPTPAVGKLMVKNLNSLQVLFFTSYVAVISLFIIVSFQQKLKLIKQFKLRDFLIFAAMGFVGVFLYNVFLLSGLRYSSAQEAFIVNYTWPVWVVIFSMIIIGETVTLKKIAAVILGFLGVYVVVAKGNIFSVDTDHFKGDLYALAGAVSYGYFSVLGKKYHYDKYISIMFYYAFSCIFITATVLIFSHIPSLTFNEIIGLLWFGIFANGLAYVFWFLALKNGDTAEMSNIIFLTPFISLLFIYFLIGEKIYYSSIVGLVIIVCGIIIQATTVSKRSQNN